MTLFMRGLGRRSWNSSGWPPLTPLSSRTRRAISGSFIRMTDRDCVLPEHGLEEQARVLFGELAKIGALEVLENG